MNYTKENKVKDIKEYNKKLTIENETLSQTIESLPQDNLPFLYGELELDNVSRISIYIFDDEHFTMIGRWASRLDLRKPGRNVYPKDQGFTSKAWNDGTKGYYHHNKLPDYEKNSKAYIDEVQKHSKISEDIIKSLSMKSRSYFAKTIKGEYNREIIGVIVIESLSPEFQLKVTEMNYKLNGEHLKFLAKLISINTRRVT